MRNIVLSHKIAIGILVVLLVVATFLTYSFTSPQGMFSGLSNDLKVIEREDGTTYTDLDGNPVSLVSYKGKPLVINAWASWIPFSESELKMLSNVKMKLGDSVTIIAINRMEDVGTVKAYLEYIGNPEGIIFLADYTDTFYKEIEGYAMPETVFYNEDGVILTRKRGVLTEAELESSIQMIIPQK